MAQVNTNFIYRTSFLIAAVLFVSSVFVFSFLLIFFYHGVPIHDFNLWKLERSYKALERYHILDSIVLEEKKYLGGPAMHGSQTCSYVVGEARSSSLSKDEILKAYTNLPIRSVRNNERIPLKVLFVDDTPWPAVSPFAEWQDELYPLLKNATSTVYLVYAAEEGYPYFGDLRCDD